MYNIDGISKFKLVFIVALCDFAIAIKLVSFNTRPGRGVPTADLDFLLDIWIIGRTFTLEIKGRGPKKTGKSLVFCQTGGVSDGSKMPNCYFGKVIFQLACRIILGPPKHVLHLV